MHLRASSYAGATKASVGQASRQRVQVPQWIGFVRRISLQLDVEQQCAEKELAAHRLVE